jgi:hypothetical protein
LQVISMLTLVSEELNQAHAEFKYRLQLKADAKE